MSSLEGWGATENTSRTEWGPFFFCYTYVVGTLYHTKYRERGRN